MSETKPPLFLNLRFYILVSSLLVSIGVIGLTRIMVASDQLFYIRSEQIFGLLSILYWYLALIISPLNKVTGKRSYTDSLVFSRRAIGVSAGYFALLHSGIATWGQLGGIGALQSLPSKFKISLLLGGVALFVLIIMMLTSFDRVVRVMTPRRWKLLHRLTYVGGIAAVLHIWLIGSHIGQLNTQLIALVLLIILFTLESWRISQNLARKYRLSAYKRLTIFLFTTTLFSLPIIALPTLLPQHHSSSKANHTSSHEN